MIRRDRALARVLENQPGLAVVYLCATQIIVWTLAPALVHSSPPLDVVESLMWGREWVIGTYKHPSMPGWLLEIGRLATGRVDWPPFLISQLFVAATFAIVFGLGRELFGREPQGQRQALAGTLLLTGCYFFSWPSVEFNHSVAQMPLWAATILSLWLAIARGRTLYWILLGVVSGLSLYAKLSSAFLLIVAAIFILIEPQARRQLATRGPWLGLLAFAVVVGPLVSWLIGSNFQPLQYASSRAEGATGPWVFIAELSASVLGVLAMAALAGLLRGGALPALVVDSKPGAATETPRAERFLYVFALAPLGLIAVLSLLTSTSARGSWAAPMLSLVGLLTAAWARQRLDGSAVSVLAKAAIAALLIVPTLYAGSVILDVGAKNRVKRQSWPQAEIAKRFGDIWSKATEGSPLKIVAGDAWTAGLVGITARDHPSILTDGARELSPWVSASRLRHQGALIVWEKRGNDKTGAAASYVPPRLLALIGARPRGEETFKPVWGQPSQTITIGYAILPPSH